MANENVPAVADKKNDEFTAALIAAGFLNPASGGSTFNRIKMSGNVLYYGDDVIGEYSLKTKEPALIVQITDAPVEYQSMWFEPELALAVDRPSISGRFCKSYFDDPTQARKFAEDGTDCNTCPVHPFMPQDQLPPEAKAQRGASKCSWKGDIEFRILEKNEDGTLAAVDETVYTLSLPTTGIIEFKGSSSKKGNPLAGSVSDENFMVKLARLGVEKWGEEGLLKAHTALRMGGVIAELRLPQAQSRDGSNSYHVASFTPIDIIEQEEQAALPTSEGADEVDESTAEAGDLPF